jgi:hypothetical protein
MHCTGNEKKALQFAENRYSDIWAMYVHRLIEHPELGKLRLKLLNCVKYVTLGFTATS